MRIAIIGAGVIGASWSALMAFHGHQVAIYDPNPETEETTRKTITDAWQTLEALYEEQMSIPWEQISFTNSIEEACHNAEWVQENAPDRLDIKHKTLLEMEEFLNTSTPIASSTTALMPSDIQRPMRYPERFFVAHPLNPPHLVPLVELVAGTLTDHAHLEAARRFYEDMGKTVICAKQERIGHIANRLNAALYREAVYLVSEGIASLEDVDLALSEGAGPRLAAMGPHLIYHLGGGKRGYEGYLDHLGPAQEARWEDLGTPKLDPKTKETLIEAFHSAYDETTLDQANKKRDDLLLAFLKSKKKFPE
jgi:3-hydroxyacyl-CoA dehydrogenase